MDETKKQIDFRHDVLYFLRTQSPEVSALVAVRIALCSVPFLASLVRHENKIAAISTSAILPIFRALQYSLTECVWSADVQYSQNVTNNSAVTLKILKPLAEDALHVAFATNMATGVFPMGSGAARRAATIASSVAKLDNAVVDRAYFADKAYLISNPPEGAGGLIDRPLWPLGKIDTEIEEKWLVFKDVLLGLDENWQVWTNWYEDRLAGKRLNQDLELAIANLDEEKYWNKGAAVTNAKIKELIVLYSTSKQEQQKPTSALKQLKFKTISKPKSFKRSDFDAVISHLQGFKSEDTWEQGDNQKPISLSEQELEILKHSLAIASLASDTPNWAGWMVKQLSGVLAVMEAFTPIIKKLTGPLPKLWNGLLRRVQKSLVALQIEEMPDEEGE